jgi:RNA polymerase sigma-70 factor, ECF subfamily
VDHFRNMNDFSRQLVALLPRLRRFCRALTRSEADADDLAQGAIERALTHQSSWQVGSRLDSWMFRIAQNLWRDELRAHRRRAEPLDELDLAGEDGRESIHRHLEARDVARAFDDLPEDQRMVLTLVVLDGMRYQEAATVLGLPIGTVMSRLARARARLATMLAEDPRRLRAAK